MSNGWIVALLAHTMVIASRPGCWPIGGNISGSSAVFRRLLQRQRNNHSSLQVCGFIDLRGAPDAMAHSPLYHVLFCVVGIMVLKEVNSVVTEPYMVCAALPVALFSNRPRVTCRMNRFMYPRPKHTVMVNGPLGTRRLPPLLDCMSCLTHAPLTLTYILQIRAEYHPEASHHLQVQPTRIAVNTAVDLAGSPVCFDTFALLS